MLTGGFEDPACAAEQVEVLRWLSWYDPHSTDARMSHVDDRRLSVGIDGELLARG